MSKEVTRRDLLKISGTAISTAIAGCLKADPNVIKKRLHSADRTTITPSEQSLPFITETELETELPLNAEEVSPSDAIQTTTGNVIVAGQADKRPFILSLARNSGVDWLHRAEDSTKDGSFNSIVETADGNLLASGWSGKRGYMSRFTQGGKVAWRQTLRPGPGRYSISDIHPRSENGVLNLGMRDSGSAEQNRDSVWLTHVKRDGTIDWALLT